VPFHRLRLAAARLMAAIILSAAFAFAGLNILVIGFALMRLATLTRARSLAAVHLTEQTKSCWRQALSNSSIAGDDQEPL